MFDQDIEALKIRNTQFSFIFLNAIHLRNIAMTIFPPSVESYSSYNSPELAQLRQRWNRVMQRFVGKLRAQFDIHGVIAPSDNFFYVRELIPVLHNVAIPYIVVDKEGTICPAYFTHFAQYIKDTCPLLADHILVWSERQKLFWQKTGVAADRISVTGQPRSDFWKQPERWMQKSELGIAGLRTNAKMFLFFSYDPWAYTPDYMVQKGEMHWDVLRTETHDVLFSFAKSHPEIDLVIKLHPQQTDLPEIENAVKNSGVKNIFLTTGPGISNQLIVNADCIIGFQTTAIIEAMITPKPIIYTFWGEAKDRWSQDLIPFHECSGINTVTSTQQLHEQLVRNLEAPELSVEQRSGRDAFVEEYFTSVDGQSAIRTLQTLDHLLKKTVVLEEKRLASQTLIRNTLINILNTAISFFMAYAMTPIILHRLGVVDYGLWVFLSIFSISGYFSLLDLGFQGAAIKYIAEFLATNQRSRLASIVNASIAFFTLAGIVCGLGLFAFNVWLLPTVFHIPSNQLELVKFLVTILSVGFLVQFPAIAFTAILEGLQRYDIIRGVNIIITLLTNVALILWATSQNGLSLLVISLVVSGLISAIIYAIYVRKLLPDITWRPWKIEAVAWKLLFSLSSKLFASKIVGLIFNNTDKILIGIFLTLQDQTNYDIVNKLHIILLSLLSIINQAILPAASEFFAKNDHQKIRELLVRATKYSAALVLPFLLFLLVLPRTAIVMWVGPDYGHLAPYVVIYCAHFFLTMLVATSSTMLVGMNKVGQVLSISIVAALLNLGISLATIQRWGIGGLMLGTSIAYLISSAIYIKITEKLFGLPIREFYRQTIQPLLIGGIGAAIVVTVALFSHMKITLLSGLGILMGTYIVFGLLFIKFGLTRNELQPILALIQKFSKRTAS